MGISRVLHIGFVTFAIAAPGFEGPYDDGLPAKKRAAEAFTVSCAGPQLLLVPCAFKRARHRLPERTEEPAVHPHHQIYLAPLHGTSAVVIAVKHPAGCGSQRIRQRLKQDVVRRALPVGPPVQPVHFNIWKCQLPGDAPGKRAFSTPAGTDNIYFHRSARTC